MMMLYFNSVIFFDLYVTISAPFYPRENRVKYYYLVAIMLTVVYVATYFKIDVDLKKDYPGYSDFTLYYLPI